MRFFPQGDDDVREMLDKVGRSTTDELFESIPEKFRLKDPLSLPAGASEMELRRSFSGFAARNVSAATHQFFLGAGAYNHDVPAAVPQLLNRSEFYTTYTPYQPEISQGTLQTIFEFQSLICLLTETEVSNASLYDGASGLSEAVLMANRVTRRPRVILSEAVHPHYAESVRTYSRYLDIDLVVAPLGEDGRTDFEKAAALADERTAAVVVQSPNFLGCVEEFPRFAELAHSNGALSVAVVSEPVSLGLLRGPGGMGADVVVGEGQSFGVPIGFGGPFVGFMGAREKLLRQMPGRIVGEARDHEGRKGYVLTVATREQHIRRERATSNICTNQGLMALAATIHLSLLGRSGLKEVALQNFHKAAYAAKRLSSLKGCRLQFSAPVFNEFVLELPTDPEEVNRALLRRGIQGGLPLKGRIPGAAVNLERSWLICVTEMNSKEQIDNLAEIVEGAL